MTQREPFAVLSQALVDADMNTARRALFEAIAEGDSVAAICDGPVRDALVRVGEKWEHGEEGILIEHRTTIVCIQLLNYYRMQMALGQGPRVAIGGTPAGDSYQVPSMMAALIFGSEGWSDINLGPDVTPEAYVSSIRFFKPTAIWISFSVEDSAHQFLRAWQPLLDEAEAANVTLFVGGRAFPAEGEGASPCLRHLPNMEALAREIRHRWPILG